MDWLFKLLIPGSGSSSLNIPVQNGREKSSSLTARNLVDTFNGLIQEMSQTFAKFLCTYSTRVKLHDHQSDVKQKVCISNIYCLYVMRHWKHQSTQCFYIILFIVLGCNHYINFFQLIEHLRSAATPWQSLATAYHHLAESASSEEFVAIETLVGLSSVSQQVSSCVASLRKVLPLVVHW